MKAKHALLIFFIPLAALFIAAAALVWYIDPFFHYHAPHTDKFFYTIDNQRSANDGIAKHFDYDAVITGSSMTANFRTSEMDALFGSKAVKLTAAGATFYEINESIETAFEHNPGLKTVVRSIDRNLLVYSSAERRNELGEYPDYLYDSNIFNDYKYLLNADVIFSRCLPMLTARLQPGFAPGHTDFDTYSETMTEYAGTFGLAKLSTMINHELGSVGEPQYLGESRSEMVRENVYKNVVAVAQAHPEATFYCFLPPYSLAWWHDRISNGEIYAQFEAEEIAIEQMLQCDNIKVFDFACRHDIISDVNNYRDLLHYGDWINSFMLRWMQEGKYQLTKENYKQHLETQLDYYLNYDYSTMLEQPRYNCDYYAAALLNQELTGIAPHPLTEAELNAGELMNARLVTEAESGALILRCEGRLGRDPEQELGSFLLHHGYSGLKLSLADGGDYSYLCFKGRNTGFEGQPAVFAYDGNGNVLSCVVMERSELAGGWQQFALDLRSAGDCTVIINGAYPDYTGHPGCGFEFKDFVLY